MVECRRNDVVVVPLRLELAAVDAVDTHASAKLHASHVAKQARWTAVRAEMTARTCIWLSAPDHAALRDGPFAVEMCGYMEKEAQRLVETSLLRGRIPNGHPA